MATVTEGTRNTTTSGTFDVAIPSHTAGDVLVIIATKSASSSSSLEVSTAGWTEIIDEPGGTANQHILAAVKSGDGSESTARITNMGAGTIDATAVGTSIDAVRLY